jgi:peptide/nickel transport system substrate-binding protein
VVLPNLPAPPPPLPRPPPPTQRVIGRASSTAAQALLAKVYLEAGNWAGARDMATAVIESGLYSLPADYRTIFETKNSAESIFELQYSIQNSNTLAFWWFPEALGGPPYLERVVFRVIPEAATLLTEQLTDRLDVNLNVEPDQADQVEDAAGLRLVAYPGRTFAYIGWNNQRPPFTDPDVRRAMTLGINRHEIVEALLFGYGVPAMSTIPPWHPFYAKELEPLPYDPVAARELLDAAGWTDPRGTGLRVNEAGVPLQFTLKTSDAPLSRAVVEVVQAQLRRIGVAVRLEILEFQTLLVQHRARDFDAVFSNWVLDNFQMASSPAALFHSQWVDVPESTNRSAVADPELDRLIDAGAVATEPDQASAVWRDFSLRLQELQPFTFMYWREDLSSLSARIQGVVMDQRGELQSMKDWWLAERR